MLTLATMVALRKRHNFKINSIINNPDAYKDTYEALITMFNEIGEDTHQLTLRYGDLPIWRLFRDYYEGPNDKLTYERISE